MQKLTAVTLTIHGKSCSIFLPLCPNKEGKVLVDVNCLLKELGIIVPRGTTISVG